MGRPAIAHPGDHRGTAERAEVPRKFVHVRFLTHGFLLVDKVMYMASWETLSMDLCWASLGLSVENV